MQLLLNYFSRKPYRLISTIGNRCAGKEMEGFGTLPVLMLLMFLYGCGTEQETRCFPGRVSTTIAEGTDATMITADYQYDGDRPDRIIFSNFQTHFFEYNDDGRIRSVARKNVQTFQNLASVYTYRDGEAVRSDEYRIRLDRFTQENTDTVQTGYRLFAYEGGNITEEQVFDIDPVSGEAVPALFKTYSYDAAGNMTTYVCRDDVEGDTIEASEYIYDSQRHPYRDLGLVFEGATHMNNVLRRTDLLTGDVYTHQVIYTPAGYPEQINIKQETYLVEVIRIDYTCR